LYRSRVSYVSLCVRAPVLCELPLL
jgi:hypothetical protein